VKVLNANGTRLIVPTRVAARYEGAYTNRNRSTITGWVRDAKWDIDRYSRQEIIRKARYFYRNSPFIRGLIERLVTLTIGTGLHPIPTTTNKGFNTLAKMRWREFARRADVQSDFPMETLQAIIFRAMLVDGDSFSLLTWSREGRPRTQIIESHRICDPVTGVTSDQPEGVELDEYDRPVRYHVKVRGEKTEPVDAGDIVPFFIPERTAQYRGISILASIINTAHDIDDILALEKAAVKDVSGRTDIIKTASGELDVDDDDLIGRSLRDAVETEGIDEAVRYYQERFGPEAVVLKHGDEYTPYKPERPSPAWAGFMDFLTGTICIATGFPPSILLGNKVGGADTRRDLATAQRVIEVWQQCFASRMQRIYEYVIRSESEDGNLPPLPSDWRSVEWQNPRKVTVDAGRESKADIEEVKAGLLTRREYFGQWGQDWREQMRQSAEEAAELRKLADEFGVDVAEIAMRDPNELSKQPQEAAANEA